MSKIAFLFSGQGSQYVGMGKEIADNYEQSRKIYQIADKELDFNVSQLCFEGPADKLNKTEYTQPAILTTSIAILEAIKTHGIECDVVAGLSLGEYSALVCNGILDFRDAVKLVRARGQYMQDAVPEGEGTMAAIVGLDNKIVEDVCAKISNDIGIVEPANYNYTGQIVIAGEVDAIDAACKVLSEKGAKRAIKLNVSGPFHTSMLESAATKLGEEINSDRFGKPNKPYVANVIGDYVEQDSDIKDLLVKQVMSSVRWEESIKNMIADGVDTFIEVGPGKTLSKFMKKIDKTKKIFNVEDIKSLNKTIEAITAVV